MKKRFVAFALLISAVVLSVTSGCVVRDGYGRGYHHDGYHHGYNNGYHDDRGHDHDGYNHY